MEELERWEARQRNANHEVYEAEEAMPDEEKIPQRPGPARNAALAAFEKHLAVLTTAQEHLDTATVNVGRAKEAVNAAALATKNVPGVDLGAEVAVRLLRGAADVETPHDPAAMELESGASFLARAGRWKPAEEVRSRLLLSDAKMLRCMSYARAIIPHSRCPPSPFPRMWRTQLYQRTLDIYLSKYPEQVILVGPMRSLADVLKVRSRRLLPGQQCDDVPSSALLTAHDFFFLILLPTSPPQARGRFAEAERIYRRSLTIQEAALGPKNADVAMSLFSLGEAMRSQNKNEDAEPLFKRSINIREKAIGDVDLPDAVDFWRSYGRLQASLGKHKDAVPKFKRCLTILERELGPDDMAVGDLLLEMGNMLHANMHKYSEAEPLYRRVVAIREKALGTDAPEVRTTFSPVGELLYLAQYIRTLTFASMLNTRYKGGDGSQLAGAAVGGRRQGG